MDAEKLQELLVEELRDLYDAEKQLLKAIPKMANTASSDQVQKALREHLETTKKQTDRLERVFELLGENAKGRPCKGMQGLVAEGEEHMSSGHDELIDSIVVGGGRKIEHYEIAAYTSALELAGLLGNRQVSRLLQQTLTEEERMDKKLGQLSERLLKRKMREAA